LEVAYSNKVNSYLRLKIKNENDLTGWINIGDRYDPYKNGTWSIIELESQQPPPKAVA
jgi:hypothetical protein